MSAVAIAFIGLVVLLLILAGVVIGWTVGTNDEHIDVLAKRLAAEQRMDQLTRDTLHAMRDALRRRT